MKPIYLEMQAFGPFVEKQCVDFEKLSESGIFLIKGRTGSGKTTVFDAMTFALYGGGSGESEKSRSGRNDFEQWRCTQADAAMTSYVSFVFSVKGHKYRFTRKLIPKRVNLSAQYEAGEYNEAGELIPFFNNPKKEDLNSKAESIIGLTKEQFRQVVLLPQGQFERFLTASSSEKESILQRIFSSSQWERYSQIFFDRAKAKKDALDQEKRDIERSLAEEGMSGLNELSEKIDSITSEKEAAEAEHKAFDGEKKQKELLEDMQLFEQFKPLHRLEKALAELNGQKEKIDGKRKTFALAENAEALRESIDLFDKCKAEADTRNSALKASSELLPGIETAVSDAEREKMALDGSSPVSALQKKLGEYGAKREIYEAFSLLDSTYEAASAAYGRAEHELKLAESSLAKATSECARLLAARNAADEQAIRFRNRYFAGIYGEIAADLAEGKKCPVCGSTHHPEPAERTPEAVSREVVDAREQAAEKAGKAWEKGESARQAAEKQRNEKARFAGEKLAEKSRAEAAFNSAKLSLIEGIADIKALDRVIGSCTAEIGAFEAKSEKAAEKLRHAIKARDELNAGIRSAELEKSKADAAFEAAEKSLATALEKNGYSDHREVRSLLLSVEKRRELHREIVRYDTSLSDIQADLNAEREKLYGKSEPDSSGFALRNEQIEKEKLAFTKNHARLSSEAERLSRKLETLGRSERHYQSEIHEAENDLAFARRLRGDTGIGIQRYVLAVMFSKVIDEANRMLRNVHGGRYSLFRSDERGSGNKRGLELKVHDNRSPDNEKGRGVAMLSGGEKFLVSLALSIGMSAVAQSSGVQIDALFIDEGFGTLDDSSIGDAMNILECVRRGCGTIGIISHVPLLDSTVSTKLEVIKSEYGSSIRPV